MKLLILLLLLSSGLYSQNSYTELKHTVSTAQSIDIDGTIFGGGYSRTGSIYIFRVSKSGKEYRSYLGYRTDDVFNGRNVWHNKKLTEYYYYTIGSGGYPKKNLLSKL